MNDSIFKKLMAKSTYTVEELNTLDDVKIKAMLHLMVRCREASTAKPTRIPDRPDTGDGIDDTAY